MRGVAINYCNRLIILISLPGCSYMQSIKWNKKAFAVFKEHRHELVPLSLGFVSLWYSWGIIRKSKELSNEIKTYLQR